MWRRTSSAIMSLNRGLLWAGAAFGYAVAITAQATGMLARSLAFPFTWAWKRWGARRSSLLSPHTDTSRVNGHSPNPSSDGFAHDPRIARAIEEVMSRVGRSDEAIHALWRMIRQEGLDPAEVVRVLLGTPYAHYALHIAPSVNDTLHQGPPFIFHTDGRILLLQDFTPETIAAALAAHPHDRDFHRQLSIALHQVMDYTQAQKRIIDHRLPPLEDFIRKTIDTHYHLTIRGRKLLVQDKENGQFMTLSIGKNAIHDLRRALPKLPDLAIRHIAVQWENASAMEDERSYRAMRRRHDVTHVGNPREDRRSNFRRKETFDEAGQQSDFPRRQRRGGSPRMRPRYRDDFNGRDLDF